MPKNKPHKGLLKRVRVTKTGKIKLQRAYGRHLRSHKSGQRTRKYRQPKYAVGADMRRLRGLLQLPAGSRNNGSTTAVTPKESSEV